MENNGFEHFSNLWKKADKVGASQKIYSEKEIKNIKMKKSKDFSRSIHNSIVFDYIHKGILILGMVLLAWFYISYTPILITLAVLSVITAISLLKEYRIQMKLRTINEYAMELSAVIKQKLQFYKSNFTTLKLILAFTNSLFVWVGSAFYYYSKYGYYKIEDLADAIVTGLMVSLAFVLSYIAFPWQLKNNVLELQESLQELDDESYTNLHVVQSKRKKKHKIALIVIGSLGIILFAILVIIYLIQLL